MDIKRTSALFTVIYHSAPVHCSTCAELLKKLMDILKELIFLLFVARFNFFLFIGTNRTKRINKNEEKKNLTTITLSG